MSNLIRFFFPTTAERSMARRYFFTFGKSSTSKKPSFLALLLTMILGCVCALVEIAYFFFQYKTPLFAMFAIALPLFFIIFLLLRFFSVFSTVAIAGVSVGVATLIVVAAVASGFIEEVTEGITGMYADLFLSKGDSTLSAQEYLPFLNQLRAHPEVKAAAPYIRNNMYLSSSKWPPVYVSLQGVDPVESPKIIRLNKWLLPQEGRTPQMSDLQQEKIPNQGGPPLPAIFIGDMLVRQLKLTKGDKITLLNVQALANLSETELKKDATLMPATYHQDYYLAGIIYTGYEKFDRTLVCVTFAQAQKFLGMGDIASGIEIRLYHPEKRAEIQKQLAQILQRGYEVNNPAKENIIEALKIQKSALSLLIFLIILVASFNVIASLTILVIHKSRSIAIAKTMGIPPWGIAAIFRVVGTNVGLLGAGIGVSLGLLVCKIIETVRYELEARVYLINHIPVHLSFYEVMITAAATVFLCSFSTLYPALRAARFQPVEGLRQE